MGVWFSGCASIQSICSATLVPQRWSRLATVLSCIAIAAYATRYLSLPDDDRFSRYIVPLRLHITKHGCTSSRPVAVLRKAAGARDEPATLVGALLLVGSRARIARHARYWHKLCSSSGRRKFPLRTLRSCQRTMISLGLDGSVNLTPRSWLSCRVAATFSSATGMERVHEPVVQ